MVSIWKDELAETARKEQFGNSKEYFMQTK